MKSDLVDYRRKYAGASVLVLGASGFIGRWVARELCAAGARVNLVVRDRERARAILEQYGVAGRIWELDLQYARAICELFAEVRPVVTFNLVAYGVDRSEQDESQMYQTNTHLVGILCDAISSLRDPAWEGLDLVHAGTGLEYGDIGGDLHEGRLPNPTTPYAKSKALGTALLASRQEAQGIKAVTARLFTVYGPGELAGRLMPSLMQVSRTGQPLKLTRGDQVRDFTYVADVAEGLLRIGLVPMMPGGSVNLATGRLTTVRRFVEIAAEILQIPRSNLLFGALPTRSEEMACSSVSVERLHQTTSWIPQTPIADGIQQTADFLDARMPSPDAFNVNADTMTSMDANS
jgi:UDP-glucose 4-epimerase